MSEITEVCPICDIAGCKHLREKEWDKLHKEQLNNAPIKVGEIKRYDYGFIKGVATGMEKKSDGDYVKIEDYEKLLEANAKLEARCKELESENVKLKTAFHVNMHKHENEVLEFNDFKSCDECIPLFAPKKPINRTQALDELAAESQRLGMYDAKKEG